jgi:hypothetical protein
VLAEAGSCARRSPPGGAFSATPSSTSRTLDRLLMRLAALGELRRAHSPGSTACEVTRSLAHGERTRFTLIRAGAICSVRSGPELEGSSLSRLSARPWLRGAVVPSGVVQLCLSRKATAVVGNEGSRRQPPRNRLQPRPFRPRPRRWARRSRSQEAHQPAPASRSQRVQRHREAPGRASRRRGRGRGVAGASAAMTRPNSRRAAARRAERASHPAGQRDRGRHAVRRRSGGPWPRRASAQMGNQRA